MLLTPPDFPRISGNAASDKNIKDGVCAQIEKNFARAKWKVGVGSLCLSFPSQPSPFSHRDGSASPCVPASHQEAFLGGGPEASVRGPGTEECPHPAAPASPRRKPCE